MLWIKALFGVSASKKFEKLFSMAKLLRITERQIWPKLLDLWEDGTKQIPSYTMQLSVTEAN